MDITRESLSRGVANIIPSKEELEKKIKSTEKLNVYLGIDPTSTKIHLGHAVTLRKLQQFVELGHNVTFLIGDYTALIGDTSDKESERPALTEEEINKNFETYKKQAEKILDFSANNLKVRRNSEWLGKLGFKTILELSTQFSLNDFISRELIKKRLSDRKRVGLHETLYPIMQAYDSFMLDTDLQIGGTDQTFNIQSGRTLIKNWKNKNSFVLTTPILEGTDGRKMSKSWGNAIWLTDSPEDMYAKVMAINDDLIIPYFTLATNVPMKEIDVFKKDVEENPMKAKKRLAFEITRELHDEKQAKQAEEHFEKAIQQKEVPFEISVHQIKTSITPTASEVLIESGITSSKSEAKRLIEQGGVSFDGNLVKDENEKIDLTTEKILKVGKKRFLKIKTS